MEFKPKSFIEKLDIVLNTINHALIAIATFYTTWYCINYGFDKPHTLHVLLASLGYQLLMAEGILSMYKGNTFTLFSSRTEKTNIHWMLQATGGILGLSAFFLEVVQRLQEGKRIFHIWHARMGLVSAIFLILSMLSGTSALFSPKLRNIFKPVFVKMAHNLFAIFAFVFGFIAMIIAYNTRSFVKNIDPGNVRYCMIGFLSCILVLTLIGPLKTLLKQATLLFQTDKNKEVEAGK